MFGGDLRWLFYCLLAVACLVACFCGLVFDAFGVDCIVVWLGLWTAWLVA